VDAFLNTTTKLPDVYFTLATAGHVDHGKTSLIKALTGTNPDRLKEEQERQMTTDLGFAHLILPGGESPGAAGEKTFGLGFIDVPGHGKFLKNMLAGVGGIELALLVVAADEGPMPQTVQHIKILSLLGVRNAVVALTKADLADAARCAVVETKVRALLERYNIKTVGLECVSTVKGENGQGIAALKKTLARALAQVKKTSSAAGNPAVAPVSGTSADAAGKPGYLPIDRVFAKSGYGTVVTGTLVEGTFNVGDQVMIEPGGIGARIRGLETFGKALDKARNGQRLAINLSAKEHKLNLSRGLCVLGGSKNVTADLFLQIFDYGSENDVEQGTAQKYKLSPKPIKLYHGTMEAAGALRWMEKLPGSPEGQGAGKSNVQAVQNIGHVHLSDAIVVSPGDRYVLRYGDDGIAGGAVLLCQKPRWLTRKLLAELAPFLIACDYDRALRFILDCHPSKALHKEQLGWIVRSELLDDCLAKLQKSGLVENLSGFFMATTVKEAIKQKTVSTLNGLLKSEEAKANGVNLETVRRLVAPHLDRKVMQELIKELGQAGLLVRKDDKLFGPSGGQAPSANLDPYTESILKHLDEVLCLELTELAKLTNSDAKKVKLAVERLAKLNLAQVINYDFASSKKWVDHAFDKLVKIWQEKKDISPADFRDELATTRKYALALLAYFDDHQVTRRTASGRNLLKLPK
jgi:selenocysteine-specific elongation factor